MGVPAFFRWLSRKYPSIVVHCKEEKAIIIDGVKVPIDITKPNPNNTEFDNLYLDMNGIIHPCCHPENKPAPKNEDEMMVDIFEYIDRLMAIIRPRRLLYMAIDGVAPRAKMNQQRSRRFRASKEAKEKRETIANLKEEMRAKGMIVPDDKPDGDHFDSNCITPGTEFMSRLAECLRFYIHLRQNNDPGWKNLIVILSDANVPGEGEHKIMDYIRRQRAQAEHDPNTHHCLCGADADLIMLGLATHEPNFTIIREEFKPTTERPCDICGQMGHLMTNCVGASKIKSGEFDELTKSFGTEQEFIFIRLNILREYLYKELLMSNLPFKQDLERAIDDWVMMCFFVGNDFLPHLPSLEIREGAIDRLIGLYKKAVYKTGGYLTDSGHVHVDRVQLVLTDLGEMEDEIFKNRREQEVEQNRRTEQRKKRERQSVDNWNAPRWMTGGQYAPRAINSSSVVVNPRQTINDMRRDARNLTTAVSNEDAAAKLRNLLNTSDPESRKRKMDESIESVMSTNDDPIDNIRLWEAGWKERYYENKFGISTDEYDFRYKVANEYVLGICWVLKYYYQGCVSWNWYFPYHYAPFASDFVDIGKLKNDFEENTQPFKPLEQLMSVFPAASKQFLPSSWQLLMDSSDSPIIDFYPIDFCVDLNGKRYAWQGVALLPFVDEKRLLKVLNNVYKDLTDYEKARNSRGSDRLFVHKDHAVYELLEALYENNISANNPVFIDTQKTLGIAGSAWCDDKYVPKGEKVLSPLPNQCNISCNQVICISYLDPQFAEGYIFPAKLLPGAKIPAAVLKPHEGHISSFRPQTGFSRDSGFRQQNNVSTMARHIRASIPPPQSLYGRGNGQPFRQSNLQPLMSAPSGPYQQPLWQNQRDDWQNRQRYNAPPRHLGGYNQRPNNTGYNNSNMPRIQQARWRY